MKEDTPLSQSIESVRKITDFTPAVGLVLGSGLGDFASTLEPVAVIPYKDIAGFPTSTVEGHSGQLFFGWVGDKDLPVVCMQGRVHYYEGYSMEEVILPIRLMGALGAKTIMLTNAAGSVNLDYSPGDFMMISDHIASFVPSPLLGKNPSDLGPRFPDMSQVYSKDLQELLAKTAHSLDIPLKQGTYLQFTGPAYETPAEIRMARALGADAVGMSTACEAMAAAHMGGKVCGISCITNYGSGISHQPLDHKDVQNTADRVAQSFQALVTAFLIALGEHCHEK